MYFLGTGHCGCTFLGFSNECCMFERFLFYILKKQTSLNMVIFLQDTHSTKEVEKLWEYQWRKKIFYSHGTSSSRGVCIALRVGLDYKLLSPEVRDDHGR